jgi:hypothetical protein
MKTKLTLIALGLVLNINLFAQPKPIEKVFNTYAGKEGFTTVDFSGNLLNLMFNDGKSNENCSLSSVKILTVDDSLLNGKINFYKEIIPNLDKSNYEQLMTVKSKGQDFVVYCKKEHNAITEFVLVSGGEDNVLIYVEGNLSLSEAKRISTDLASTNKLRDLETSND